jgi:hypothetical protein
MTHSGSCLCAGISFGIDSALEPVQVCHCSQCRKAQGGPFATNIPVKAAAFHLDDPQGLLKSYESSPGKQRWFCGRCGSPVFSRRLSAPDVVRVRAGLLHEPVKVTLAGHAYVGSKCSWWPIEDGLPQYDGAVTNR